MTVRPATGEGTAPPLIPSGHTDEGDRLASSLLTPAGRAIGARRLSSPPDRSKKLIPHADISEETVALVVNPRGKEQHIGWPSEAVVTERQPPEALDRSGVPVLVC